MPLSISNRPAGLPRTVAPQTPTVTPQAQAGTSQSATVARAKAPEAPLLIDANAKLKAEMQQTFKNEFSAMAADKDAFHAKMKFIYGAGYDAAKAEQFRQQALKGDYRWLPPIRFLSNEDLKGANGAYSAQDNIVYINQDLKGDPAQAAQTYIEEVGHYLDTQLNKADARGDEGELFRDVMAGVKLTEQQVQAIRSDNDHGTIVVDGQTEQVEFKARDRIVERGDGSGGGDDGGSWLDAIAGAATAVGGAIKDGGEWLVDKGEDIVEGAGEALEGLWDGSKAALGGLKDGFVDLGKGLWQAGNDLVHGRFGDALGDLGRGFAGFGKGVAKGFVDGGAQVLQGVGSGVAVGVGWEQARDLNGAERQLAQRMFGDALDIGAVEIHRGGTANLLAPHTMGNSVYLPDTWDGQKLFNTDNSLTKAGMEVLAHELGHVWQYQHGGSDYVSESLAAQVEGKLADGTRDAAYAWRADAAKGVPFGNLNPEQQAEIIEVIGKAVLAAGSRPAGPDDIARALGYDPARLTDDQKKTVAYVMDAWQQVRAGQGAP